MNKILHFTFLFLFLAETSVAQQNDLDFLVQKIKTDYPAYAEKTKDVDFDQFVANTVSENKTDTFKMMAKIVDFFKDRHLDLHKDKDTLSAANKTTKYDFEQALSYLHSRRPLKKYEGFWLSNWNHCVIAIVQTSSHPLRYKGYLVERRKESKAQLGAVYYDFEQIADKEFFTRATSSYSGKTFYIHSIFRSDSLMDAGPYTQWRKINNYKQPLLTTIELLPDTATGQWLDSNNYVIRIPTSTPRNGEIVDSLIKANPVITTRLQNLIVDIRGNTGGRVMAFASLLPLLYTNPILKVNGSIYCTKDGLNNLKEDFKEYLAKGNTDSNYVLSYNEWIKLEQDSFGKLIPLPQDTLILDTVLPYPKRVAFLTNFGVQSAAEIILLDAKQSKKVALFGEHTMGAIDHLDFFPRPLPSGKYQLYIAGTVRTIPKGQTKLDGIGIYPDVPISDSEKDWVDFVKRYYEQH
jgi:hypothetical protein